jgi:hypothetical protein
MYCTIRYGTGLDFSTFSTLPHVKIMIKIKSHFPPKLCTFMFRTCLGYIDGVESKYGISFLKSHQFLSYFRSYCFYQLPEPFNRTKAWCLVGLFKLMRFFKTDTRFGFNAIDILLKKRYAQLGGKDRLFFVF